MSHNFVTVCVVCVLCAAHTPCSAHTDLSAAGQTAKNSVNSEEVPGPNEQLQPALLLMKYKETEQKDMIKLNLINLSTYDNGAVRFSNQLDNNKKDKTSTLLVPVVTLIKEERSKDVRNNDKLQNPDFSMKKGASRAVKNIGMLENVGQTEMRSNDGLNNTEVVKGQSTPNRIRTKRDVDVIDEKYFMKKIFESYGDGTSVTMEGFEKLLKKLGLLRLLADTLRLENHNIVTSQPEDPLDKSKNFQNNGLPEYQNGIKKDRCLNSKELLSIVASDIPLGLLTNNSTLPNWLFERVCPALVYQLAGESSSERNGCIHVPENYKPVTVNNYLSEDGTRNMIQVWAYSTISILVISLCGLLGVAVIPCMGKVYYQQLLQFLVALAVGTLCGDALIHLLPHAMMSHDHDHEHIHNDDKDHAEVNHNEQHNMNMWKGLVAMMGLALFFFTEKALSLLAEWRKRRQRRNKLPSRVRVMRETDGPNSNVVGEKLCKHKYSSYPYCYGEISTDVQDNHHNRQHNNHERPPVIEEEKPLTSNCNSVSKTMTNDVEKKQNDDWRLDDSMVNTKKNVDGADVLIESESYTVIIREHETKHHGHTHSHGHVHSAPESMSSVAWMVIMGDGLHNFTDGMAIGAAFSANIAGGFSTAIAVFCHELPHEIGDFAVLLKAGMSAKQAVFYNLLSSILCLFGMIFGVLLGSTPAVSSWMFAAAAGMFIYIALVDMIPELSSSHSAERSSQWQCILQGLGLLCGLGIMLIIAMYEHDLKNMFSD